MSDQPLPPLRFKRVYEYVKVETKHLVMILVPFHEGERTESSTSSSMRPSVFLRSVTQLLSSSENIVSYDGVQGGKMENSKTRNFRPAASNSPRGNRFDSTASFSKLERNNRVNVPSSASLFSLSFPSHTGSGFRPIEFIERWREGERERGGEGFFPGSRERLKRN